MKQGSKVILILLLMAAANVLHAQAPTTSKRTFDPSKETIFTSDTNLVHNIGWVRAPFWDNWYVEAAPGIQRYFGQEDNLGKLKDRITWNGEVHLGRWVFPMVGYRLGFGLGYAHGFVSKDTYYDATGNITAGGGGVAYGWGQCDSNYGGYYHNYSADTSLFIQKWRHSYFQFDVMANLTYGKEYNPNRPLMSWLYFGFSTYFGLSEGYEGSGGTVSKDVDPNRAAEMHVGFIEQYQLSENWHVFVDLRFSAMQRTFDREWIRSIERPLDIADGMFNMHFGVEYNFNWRPENRRTDWYKSTIDPDYNGTSAPHHVMATQNVNYTVINYMDTIFTYDTIDDNSPEYYRRQAELAKKTAEDSIAAAKQRFENNCKEATLDDILSRHLLPYEMIFFELDQWDILSSENIKIAKMASLIKSFPDYKFLLIGSADSKTGSVKRNDFLSHNRSDVVYNKLVIDYGCDPKQLERVYMGGILDFKPYELNRATVIIMKHPKVMQEFNKLKSRGQAGGSSVSW